MSASLLWKELSAEQTEELIRSLEVGEGRDCLVKSLRLDSSTQRGAIETDLYYYAVHFCCESKFTAEKTSATIGILRAVHTHSMDKFWPLERSMSYFKEMLVLHSVQRPPYSVGIFTLQDVSALTDYITESYFRHYNLYKYAFTKRTLMDVSSIDSWTETPVIPESLASGISREEQERKMAEERAEQEKAEEENRQQALAAAQAELDAAKAALPAEVQAKIEQVVAAQMEAATSVLKGQIGSHQDLLVKKLEVLQRKLVADGV